MSAIRARYDGPSGTGVDINVELDSGEIRPVHVPKGGMLPTDLDGQTITAAFRNRLLEQDGWSKVNQPTTSADKAATDTSNDTTTKGS